MKTGPLLPLALGLIGQYFTIAILVSTYPEQLYFPGVRIAALVLFLLLDVSAYVLWRSLIRPQFSVLRDLPQPTVCHTKPARSCSAKVLITYSRPEAASSLDMLALSSAVPWGDKLPNG